MGSTIEQVQKPMIASPSAWEESYRQLPCLFFGLLVTWMVLVCVWTLNTWTKRQWQTSNLQWVLTIVPMLKAIVLGLSFIFWYSCLNLSTCSFWVAFGVFVTRIFFETACFVAFLLIAHGYCTMHEQLTITERRSIAGLASLLYLTLTGYKAAVPQFGVLVVLIYGLLLYVIVVHVARNLSALRAQLQQIQEEGIHMLHSAVYTKYTMFKNFQRAMLIMAVAEILMYGLADGIGKEYWVRLLLREFVEIGIFFYIGWTFRSRELTPFFTVIPTLHPSGQRILPPIYCVEINEKQFNNLDHKEWHIGVNPGMSDFASSDDLVKKPNKLEDTFHMRPNFQRVACHTQPSVTSSKGPGLFSSMIDYERLQLRQRSCGDLSSSIESGSRRDNQFPSSCEQSVKEGSRFPDGKDVKNPIVFVSDVVVDLKGLKGYSLLQCESPCGDYRTLHSRSTSILTSQELAPLQSSIV
uniref:Uncharacterized protein n=1 Tax=Physcomitrium patens TaxID=3218 RepID=A0A7I4FMW1_PHYPA